MRRLPIFLALCAVALFASGCIRSDVSVTVNDDGSGTYSAVVAFNPKTFADLAKMTGEDISDQLGDDPCKEMRDSANENKADLPTGAKIENYTDGDYCGVKISAPFKSGDDPAAAISEALSGFNDTTGGVSGIGLEDFSITKSGDGWLFQASPPQSDTGDSSDAAFAKQFLQDAYSVVRIKLPGRMVEKDSNPDAIDGNGAMIWNINLLGDTRTLKAHTVPGAALTNKVFTDAGKSIPGAAGGGSSSSGGSSKMPWIIGGLVALAAIVGFVLWRKSKAGATPAMAMPGGAPMAPAPLSSLPNTATWGAPAPAAPAAAPVAPPTASVPPVAPPEAAPTTPQAAFDPNAANGQPQWDPARNAYLLWDAGSSKWLQYDNAAGAWIPLD